MVVPSADDAGISARILSEYREMPGLRLTLEQAARLWAMDVSSCREALESLVSSGRLGRTVSGQYCVTADLELIRKSPQRSAVA